MSGAAENGYANGYDTQGEKLGQHHSKVGSGVFEPGTGYKEETAAEAAARGTVATDQYGMCDPLGLTGDSSLS